MSQPNPVPRPPKIPRLNFRCPYCKYELSIDMPNGNSKEIQTCYKEIGGCGKDFILVTEKIIKFRTLKIEGED